ncbi:MAG: FAD:protein FMN transferase [Nitrospirae bacterium]|nr:FAD:protein FMN transferase [Nitrospirota bacterium]
MKHKKLKTESEGAAQTGYSILAHSRSFRRDSSASGGFAEAKRILPLDDLIKLLSEYQQNKPLRCYILFILLLFTVLACVPQKDKVYQKSQIIMDTVVTITVVSDSSEKAETAIDRTFSEVEKLNKLLNFYSSLSEVSEINKNAGIKSVPVSPETIEVIEKAIHTAEKTYGAFDITIGPVMTLWDFHKKVLPEDKSIKEKLSLVNYKGITIDKNRSSVYLQKKGMLIDLGGIAKGYAADKAVEVMKRNGIQAGLVSIAGDIKAFGLKPENKPWKIGIKNPRQKGKNNELIATIDLTDMAISTSGDYERYFITNGKRYHHILNPKTGYPAYGCQSVSILAPDGSVTDPLSTGIFILGTEKGLKLLEELGLDGIIVDKDGKIHTTPRLRGKIEITRNN